MATAPARPPRLRRARWGLRLLAVVSGLVLAAGGVGHAVVSGLGSGLSHVDAFGFLADRPAPSRGLTLLVVGVDSRAGLTPRQRREHRLGGRACQCADTLMLVHFSANRRRMTVVSLPRDSYTRLPAHRDPATGRWHPGSPQKLNAAMAHGGARLTVRAVEAMTRVRVDHYLEIDFAGFLRAVDALGGVQVCTPRPLHDRRSGLHLPAGTSTLNGRRALGYVRARSLDGQGDLGRMRRQQRLVAAVLEKLTSTGTLLHPARLNEAAGTLLRSVRADTDFGQREVVELGRALHGLTPATTAFRSVPIADPGHPVPSLGETVLWDRPAARRLFTALREDRPLPPDPADRDGGGRSDGTGGPGAGESAGVGHGADTAC